VRMRSDGERREGEKRGERREVKRREGRKEDKLRRLIQHIRTEKDIIIH
jgi:hypothetical protein